MRCDAINNYHNYFVIFLISVNVSRSGKNYRAVIYLSMYFAINAKTCSWCASHEKSHTIRSIITIDDGWKRRISPVRAVSTAKQLRKKKKKKLFINLQECIAALTYSPLMRVHWKDHSHSRDHYECVSTQLTHRRYARIKSLLIIHSFASYRHKFYGLQSLLLHGWVLWSMGAIDVITAKTYIDILIVFEGQLKRWG